MKKPKRQMIVEKRNVHNANENSVFLWCLHCGRTYRRGECRVVKGLQMCPYDGCDGDTVLDAVPWGAMRSAWPAYPVIPERGRRYADMRGDECREGVLDVNHLAYFEEKLRNAKPEDIEFFGA